MNDVTTSTAYTLDVTADLVGWPLDRLTAAVAAGRVATVGPPGHPRVPDAEVRRLADLDERRDRARAVAAGVRDLPLGAVRGGRVPLPPRWAVGSRIDPHPPGVHAV